MTNAYNCRTSTNNMTAVLPLNVIVLFLAGAALYTDSEIFTHLSLLKALELMLVHKTKKTKENERLLFSSFVRLNSSFFVIHINIHFHFNFSLFSFFSWCFHCDTFWQPFSHNGSMLKPWTFYGKYLIESVIIRRVHSWLW